MIAVGLGLYWMGYGGQLAMSAFLFANAPSGEFDPTLTAAAPNYAEPSNWAALPATADPADLIPAGVGPRPDAPPADTFFIHK